LSAVALCQAAVPAMKERHWGRVLAITSLSVRRPNPKNMMSGMARAGLTSFLKALSFEVASHGITVNSIQPGVHETARLAELYGERISTVAEDISVRTLGRAEDFGDAAAFLCSDQARFITGSSLLVDGGMYQGLC
jgi:3-oxoacyl-[acyl-carrier protein] reductase